MRRAGSDTRTSHLRLRARLCSGQPRGGEDALSSIPARPATLAACCETHWASVFPGQLAFQPTVPRVGRPAASSVPRGTVSVQRRVETTTACRRVLTGRLSISYVLPVRLPVCQAH